jgi:hypothetical protein
MKQLKFGVIAVALAVAFSAFTTPGAKTDTEYWVYTSPTNQEFQYAYKYEIQTLSSQGSAGCDNGQERPCILGTVAAIGSDSTALHNYLATTGQVSSQTQSQIDQDITVSSLETQSEE